ncbi:MAG: acetyl-CoA carboxylase biotin carboxyl carrier protein subunit [Bacteroidetes bacterium]|nr:acetyl-CoA carboxylase biotin carboxyl carrier protein subunit [Bacteroidota bacterium]
MEKQKFKAIVNEEFDVDNLTANGLDVVKKADGKYHILDQHKSYIAEIISADFKNKTFHIKVNDRDYHIKLADQYDQLIRELGLSVAVTHKINHVKAPMPGLVLKIMVEPGATILQGDDLLILEAMKMENVIKSPGDGSVKNILVKKGAAVEKGQILIEME